MKFKVGDKVRHIDSNDGWDTWTITELPGNNTTFPDDYAAINHENKKGLLAPNSFKLIETINDEYLQSLIDKANEGESAAQKLRKIAPKEVIYIFNGIEKTMEYYSPIKYRFQLAKSEKKFTLQGYEVIITKDLCQVGCRKDFHFRELMLELRQLTREGNRNSGEWEVSREGIYNTRARGALSWENADKLLIKLEQFEKENS